MPCYELSVVCAPQDFAYLSERLWGESAFTSIMEDLIDEVPVGLRLYSQDTLVDAAAEKNALDAWHGLVKADSVLDQQACMLQGIRLVEDEEWAESWKRFWHPQDITPRLWVCPSWEPVVPGNPDAVVLTLDPGSAFGTGTHATTRLMLEALEELADAQDLSNLSVLDVGTGSGILAIYAAKKGSRQVMALDIDPLAEPAVQDNLALNHVTDVVTFTTTLLSDLCRTRYDVVLVNIIAPVILSLWEDILLRVEPNGWLYFSGLIDTSVPLIQEALTRSGWTHQTVRQQGDWFAVHARKSL
jgi:ribosomal protein L11 methyltransferase